MIQLLTALRLGPVSNLPIPTGVVVNSGTKDRISSILSNSSAGKWALNLASKLGTKVRIINDGNAKYKGAFSPSRNRITLNAAKNSTDEEMAVTFIHEAIHLFGIKGTSVSEVIARIGSGYGNSISQAAHVTVISLLEYGGIRPMIGHGFAGELVSVFSMSD